MMTAMEVEVRYYAMIREATGRRIETVAVPPKSSVGRYGRDFTRYVYDGEKRVRDYLSFMLNGINVNSLKGFETLLKDGDVLSILPPVGGG
jgi:MoaD family protein